MTVYNSETREVNLILELKNGNLPPWHFGRGAIALGAQRGRHGSNRSTIRWRLAVL